MDEPVILQDAYKHGVKREDMLHALRNVIRFWDLDDMTMIVGPDRAGRLLEVGVSDSYDGSQVIVHAMEAREKFLPRG